MALAPAGGWAPGDESYEALPHFQLELQQSMKAAAPHAEAILARAEGRRRSTRFITTNFEHIPVELMVYQLLGVASCGASGKAA